MGRRMSSRVGWLARAPLPEGERAAGEVASDHLRLVVQRVKLQVLLPVRCEMGLACTRVDQCACSCTCMWIWRYLGVRRKASAGYLGTPRACQPKIWRRSIARQAKSLTTNNKLKLALTCLSARLARTMKRRVAGRGHRWARRLRTAACGWRRRRRSQGWSAARRKRAGRRGCGMRDG